MNQKCNLLGGPLDGQLQVIPEHLSVWYVAERPKPRLDFSNCFLTEADRAKVTKYIRQTSRTFMHESEEFNDSSPLSTNNP